MISNIQTNVKETHINLYKPIETHKPTQANKCMYVYIYMYIKLHSKRPIELNQLNGFISRAVPCPESMQVRSDGFLASHIGFTSENVGQEDQAVSDSLMNINEYQFCSTFVKANILNVGFTVLGLLEDQHLE